MRRTRSLTALLGSLALAAGSLSACSTAEKVADAADPVADAVAATSKQSGSRFEMTMSMSAPGIPAPFSIKATGLCDPRSNSVQMTMDMSSMLDATGGAPPEGIDRDDLQMEMRIVGGAMYARSSLLATEIAPGKTWLKVDLDDLAKSSGIDPSLLTQYQDPTQMLSYLKAAGEVDRVGEATVRGDNTTRYRARLDFSKALRDLTSGDEATRRQLEVLKASVGDTELPVDVWIDEDDLVRRMRMVMKFSDEDAKDLGADVKVDMQMFDYGTKVNVKAPPAEQVGDGSSVFLGSADAGAPSAP